MSKCNLALNGLFAIALGLPGCGDSSRSCTTAALCSDVATIRFEPALVAAQQFDATLLGDGQEYSATYSAGAQTGESMWLRVNTDSDAGVLLEAVELLYRTPSTIVYSVSVDGDSTPVTQGTVSPQYDEIAFGSGDCVQTCGVAVETIPVTQ